MSKSQPKPLDKFSKARQDTGRYQNLTQIIMAKEGPKPPDEAPVTREDILLAEKTGALSRNEELVLRMRHGVSEPGEAELPSQDAELAARGNVEAGEELRRMEEEVLKKIRETEAA